MARKPKISPQIIDIISKGLQAGNYAATVLDYAGVSTSAYYNWLNRGEKEIARLEALEEQGETDPKPLESEAPYVDLVDAVKKASAAGEMQAVSLIRNAFNRNWTAAMTFLERRFPDRWGRRDRHYNINADLTQAEVDKLFDQLEPEELNEIERILAVADQRRADQSVQSEEKS